MRSPEIDDSTGYRIPGISFRQVPERKLICSGIEAHCLAESFCPLWILSEDGVKRFIGILRERKPLHKFRS